MLKALELTAITIWGLWIAAIYAFTSFFTGLGAGIYYLHDKYNGKFPEEWIDNNITNWFCLSMLFWLLVVLIWDQVFDPEPFSSKRRTMDISTELQPLIDKVKKKSTFMKWGVGLAGVLLLAPLVWALAYAILGVAALGASLALAGAVGMAVIYYTPVYTMKLQNRKIQAIVDEATKNPIPTLRVEWNKDGEEIETLRAEIKTGDSAVESAWLQVQGLSADLTADDMAGFRADYESQKGEVAAQYEDLAVLEKNHRKADVEIKRLDAVWTSANAMSKASAMTRASSRMDAISAIKRDAALKSVMSASAEAKANIRARIEQRKSAAASLQSKGGVAMIEGQVITDGGMPVTFATPETVKVKS